MIQLLDGRKARYSDAMKLERLVEAFSRHACSDSRDRIYGLVGFANDIRPFFDKKHFNDPVEDHIDMLDMNAEIFPTLPRGMGRVRVEYGASFYNIWRDVMKNIYFRVAPLPHECKFDAWTAKFKDEERRISVVRTAGIMQSILG